MKLIIIFFLITFHCAEIAGEDEITVVNPDEITVLPEPINISSGLLQSFDGTIPEGALSMSDTLVRSVVASPPSATKGIEWVGGAVNVTLASGNTKFNKDVTFRFTIVPAILNAQLLGRSDSLVKPAYYDGSRWIIIENSILSGNTVTFSINHLTIFAVVIVAPPSHFADTVVYPNPFRSSLAAHSSAGITFTEVPANTDLKIYTVAGELVKQLKDEDKNGEINWNAKNENGENLTSGVYLSLLKSEGKKKVIKIAIQR